MLTCFDLINRLVLTQFVCPDVALCGWLGLKHQLLTFSPSWCFDPNVECHEQSIWFLLVENCLNCATNGWSILEIDSEWELFSGLMMNCEWECLFLCFFLLVSPWDIPNGWLGVKIQWSWSLSVYDICHCGFFYNVFVTWYYKVRRKGR